MDTNIMFNFADVNVRFAYRLGFDAIQFGDIHKDDFPPNPYDLETEPNLFNAYELGFEDGYAEELEMIKILEE